MLEARGIAGRALEDRDLAKEVARHKSMFFRESDAAGEQIDYLRAISGELRLIPENDEWTADLRSDCLEMIDAGLLESEAPTFGELLESIRTIEKCANEVRPWSCPPRPPTSQPQ